MQFRPGTNYTKITNILNGLKLKHFTLIYYFHINCFSYCHKINNISILFLIDKELFACTSRYSEFIKYFIFVKLLCERILLELTNE